MVSGEEVALRIWWRYKRVEISGPPRRFRGPLGDRDSPRRGSKRFRLSKIWFSRLLIWSRIQSGGCGCILGGPMTPGSLGFRLIQVFWCSLEPLQPVDGVQRDRGRPWYLPLWVSLFFVTCFRWHEQSFLRDKYSQIFYIWKRELQKWLC